MADKHYTRREFIRNLSLAAAAGMSLPLFSSCTREEKEDFLQKHFKEMTLEEKKSVIAKLEERYLQKYRKKFQISTQEALPGTLWGYGLDLSRCIGCRRCVYACAMSALPEPSLCEGVPCPCHLARTGWSSRVMSPPMLSFISLESDGNPAIGG